MVQGEDRIRYVLERKPTSPCLCCKQGGHTYVSCPKRPCYLCRKPGHVQSVCPYRRLPGAHEATLHQLLATRAPKARPFSYLRSAELDDAHPSMLCLRNSQFDSKVVAVRSRLHERRVTCLEYHPSGRYLLSGDKRGNLVVLHLGDQVCRGFLDLRTTAGCVNHCNINAIAFEGDNVVYTSSSDGTVQRVDLNLASEGSVEAAPGGLVEPAWRDAILDMNPGGWRGTSSWRMAYGMDFDARGRHCLYAGDCKGDLHRVDPRVFGKVSVATKIHGAKIQHIHVNPVQSDIFVTASNDRKVRLWDARKVEPGHDLGSFAHSGCLSSAYFSPNTGAKLLTTSHDNRLRLWGDIHAFVGDVNARSDAQPVEIVHSCGFFRYLSPFKAVWDPKDWKDDLFLCGRSLGDTYVAEDDPKQKEVLLHPIDMFSARNGKLVNSLVDINIRAVCPVNRFSPVDPVIGSGTSMNVVLWSTMNFRSKRFKHDGDDRIALKEFDDGNMNDDASAKHRKAMIRRTSKILPSKIEAKRKRRN